MMHIRRPSHIGKLLALVLLPACQPDRLAGPAAEFLNPQSAQAADGLNLLATLYLPGSFVVQRAIWADRNFVYAGSFQGEVFVMSRRTAGFPTVQTLAIGAPISAVRGSRDVLYVASADGYVRSYAIGEGGVVPVAEVRIANHWSGALQVFGQEIYVAIGQGEIAVNRTSVFLTRNNDGDHGVRLNRALQVTGTYGLGRERSVEIEVYDRRTTAQTGVLPGPVSGNLLATDAALYQTEAGCCGAGIRIIDLKKSRETFISRFFTNVIVPLKNGGMIGGTEGGAVDVFDANDALVSSLYLPAITGHTQLEDIEIRSLWVEGDLIFAGSSWGNDRTRGPSLPSFFVIQK